VFDGHGGAEVAKFCQKYMAAEMQQLRAFNDNVLEQSLIDVFHRMDEMLSDHAYADELEALKTRERDDDDDDDGPGALGGPGRLGGGVFGLGGGMRGGAGAGGGGQGDDEGVTPMDALEMLKRVFQLKRFVASEQQREQREAAAAAAAAAAVAEEEEDDEDAGEEGAAARRRLRPAAAAGDGDVAAVAGRNGTSASKEGDDDDDAMDDADDRPSTSSGSGATAHPPPPQRARILEPPGERVQAGCTAVVALKRGNDLYVANAGDSRAVLCRAGGEALALSEDHKPAHATERDRILAAGGFLSEIGGVCRVNGNLNLSRAIGDLKYKQNQGLHPRDQIITAQPDVRHVRLEPGKDRFLLLACDGVWDVMTNQEAVDFVSARLDEGRTAAQSACDLIDACLAPDPKEARGVGCDNMTAIVVLLHLDGRDYAAEVAAAKEKEAEKAEKEGKAEDGGAEGKQQKEAEA
jgi:serine/threonine protein phosphatase PrpC